MVLENFENTTCDSKQLKIITNYLFAIANKAGEILNTPFAIANHVAGISNTPFVISNGIRKL
jgi:hypothetical protein